jgi:hypothetical protein
MSITADTAGFLYFGGKTPAPRGPNRGPAMSPPEQPAPHYSLPAVEQDTRMPPVWLSLCRHWPPVPITLSPQPRLPPRVKEVTQYLSFCIWLISLYIMSSRSIHVIEKDRILSFLWLHGIPVSLCVCVCGCVLRFLYAFLCWWTLKLVPHHGYWEYRYFLAYWFSLSLWTSCRIAGSYGCSSFNFLKNLILFSLITIPFTFPPPMGIPQTLTNTHLLSFSHSNRREEIPCSNFDLHFFDPK